MSKHTPGPWIMVAEKDGILVMPPDGGMCVSVTIPGRKPTAQDKANARLIAAAPELLAALHGMLSHFEDFACTSVLLEKSKAARAAIAKAEAA